MTIASGIEKEVRYKKETIYGVAPGSTGSQLLRRTTSSIDLSKETYESDEIASHGQIVDMRHGLRSVGGDINGELSVTTYQDFFAAALRKAWVAGVNSTALTNVTASATAPQFIRASGSWLTDGFKIGDVIQWGGWVATTNNSYNYRITALTATDMTVSGTVAAEASGASVTATVQGKKVYAPTSGQTSDSFHIEHFFSDIGQSELFSGLMISKIDVDLPPTGMGTINLTFIGQDITTDASEYFTTPATETTTAVLAAINGALRVNGTDIATITGLSFTIDTGITPGDGCVGSNVIPFIFPGRIRVSGQFTAYYEDGSLRDNFIDEDEIAINIKLDATSADNTECLIFDIPRIKLSGSSKDDGEKGLIQTVPFTGLLNSDGGDGISTEETTISIQDTTL